MKHLCIYHKNCADGLGAALAVKRWYDGLSIPEEDREFLPAQYGDQAPDVTGKSVTVVDFSYPRPALLKMNEQAAELLVIDHHVTAKEDLEGLEFCYFDMTQSGAMLTWKYFLSPSYCMDKKEQVPNVPWLIQYIQDRDLWDWKLDQSKEVSAALQLIPMTIEAWGPYLDNSKIGELIAQGEIILKYQQQQIDKIANSKLPMIHLCGHSVPCINTTTLISEIGDEISKSYPFAVMYFDTGDKRVYSLRSQDDGEDVSVIAKKFGGGGHKNAAGFSIDKDEMLAYSVIAPNGESDYLVRLDQAFNRVSAKMCPEADTLDPLGDTVVVHKDDFYVGTYS